MIRTLTDRNLLIFTLFFIIVAYILYRATNSVQDKAIIKLDNDSLSKQLANLKDTVSMAIGLLPQYKLDQLSQLTVIIENKSSTYNVVVDWDQCALTDLEGRARRVIRVFPGMTSDLFQSQAISIIPSGQKLRENITAEDSLKRESDDSLKITSPLFDLNKLKNGRPPQKKMYREYMNRSKPLEFYLQMVLRLVESTNASPIDPLPGTKPSYDTRTAATGVHTAVTAHFTIEKQPWLDAVSWRPKPRLPLRP